MSPSTSGTPTIRTHRPALSTTAAAVILSVLLLVSVPIAIGLGSAVISPTETLGYLHAAITGGTISADDLTRYQIIWQVRTPRVLLAAVVGAGLAAVGVAIQAMVRNALADPFILGVSSGASVGAVTVSVTGGFALGVYGVSAGAFIGALVASALVYFAATSAAGVTPLRLVLTGVAMSFGFQAVMSVIIYFVPSGEAAGTMLFWLMGGFGGATWDELPLVAVAVLAGILILAANCRGLDILSLGDEVSASLGINGRRLRAGLFAASAITTGAMVAVSGAIGFIGLVMPHVVRILVGASHARVLAVAPTAGALLMVWVDLASRVLFAPRELPLGVITALIGVPVFLVLLRRRSYLFGSR